MAFHHPHDLQAFYRMHNIKRFPTGPHTRWPNRAEMGVRLFKKFLSALVDTASKNLDQTTVAQITPALLMRKAATVRNTQVTLSGKTPMELAMGRRPRDLMDLASMNPEQLTATPTKQDLLNEEIQKIGYEDTSRGTTTRRHSTRSCRTSEVCSSRSKSTRTSVLLARRDPSKIQQGRKIWKMVEGGNQCCQGHHGCYQYWYLHFWSKCQ